MYTFPDALRSAYESLPIPIVFDQYIDGKVIPLLVTDGFCELVDMERARVMAWFTSGQFERVHPDDVGRLYKIGDDFANHRGNYDVIFRCRHADGYHAIQAMGKWQTMPDGTELAALVYLDLSRSKAEFEKLTAQYQLFQRDIFYTDSLTGLPNINYLHEFSNERIHALRVDGKTPMLLYFDVNSMQFYNNQYGFNEGDRLLKLITEVLKDAFPGALITRGADDHFIVIDAFEGKEVLAEKITAVNERIKSEAFGNTTGIQVGVCVFDENASMVEALDHAKNAIKRIGTDLNETFRIYSHEAEVMYWDQRYIVENFDKALESGWIKVYYQGIQRLKTGRTCAFEALARWVDPVRGIISPGVFIPVLERYHLLYKLDLYMVEQVCREIPVRHEVRLPLVPVSINFSAQDFDYVDIPSAIEALYRQYGIEDYVDRDHFIIEITEQDMATATDRFLAQLKTLKSLGYGLWLDDFGSGYSSLNVFSRFDVDLIKFDLDFLRNLDAHNGVNRKILKAMVGIARDLGIHTLVEGMETEEQQSFLREIDCELAQGFLFRTPVPLESILYMIKHSPYVPNCETTDERKQFMRRWMKK